MWALILACGSELSGLDAAGAPGWGAEPRSAVVEGPEVLILPEAPGEEDDLYVRIGGRVQTQARYRWFRDGDLVAGLRAARVPASETATGEEWMVRAELLAGPDIGSTVSASVEVGIPPLEPPQVMLSTAQPMALTDDLVCDSVHPSVDGAGTPVEAQVEWTRDGVLVSSGLESDELPGDTVPASALQEDQQWVCTVSLFTDGEPQTSASATAVVQTFDARTVDVSPLPPLSISPAQLVEGFPMSLTYRGDLAGEPELELLVGFNGWVLEPDGSEPFWTEEGAELHQLVLPSSRNKAGEHVASTLLPAGARSVHLIARTPDGVLVDDRDRQEYHWHVGFPYVGPYLQWGNGATPGQGVLISWENSTPSLGVVEWGPAPLPDRVSMGEEVDTMHHVLLDDLEPGSSYVYRVHDNLGNRSELYTFETPALDTDDYAFLVMADAQDGDEAHRWAEIADEAAATLPEAGFVLFAGDMVFDDHPGYWWRFFAGAQQLLATRPIVPVIGNHDTPGTRSTPEPDSFLRWFPVPSNGDAPDRYRLDYGNARLLLMSTEDWTTLQPEGDQELWLRSELDAISVESGVDWVFTSQHHPPYDAGARFAGETTLYRPVTQSFDGVVDWVFAAHEHLAQRFQPARYDAQLASSGRYGTGSGDGVGYMVLPSAGSSLSQFLVSEDEDTMDNLPLLAYPDPSAPLEPEHGFVTVRIDGREIVLRSWAVGTDEAPTAPVAVDQVGYSKP